MLDLSGVGVAPLPSPLVSSIPYIIIDSLCQISSDDHLRFQHKSSPGSSEHYNYTGHICVKRFGCSRHGALAGPMYASWLYL